MLESITETIDSEAVADWRGIQAAAAKHHRARIKVSEYSEKIIESERQRKWLNGVAIPYLMDKWGRSHAWVKTRLKVYCGEGLFASGKERDVLSLLPGRMHVYLDAALERVIRIDEIHAGASAAEKVSEYFMEVRANLLERLHEHRLRGFIYLLDEGRHRSADVFPD